MTYARSAVIRGLVICMLVLSVIGATQSVHAAGATKAYTNSPLHFSLSYPSNWTLMANVDSATYMGKLEANINKTALMIVSPDKTANFAVLVKTSASTPAAVKANVTAFLKEGNSLVGAITYQEGTTSGGMHLLMAAATEKGDATHTFQVTMVAGSKGHFTWYTGASYGTKYPNTTSNKAAVNSIMDSFKNL